MSARTADPGVLRGLRHAPHGVPIRAAAEAPLAARAGAWLWSCAPCVAAGLCAAIPVINSTITAVHAGWVPAGDDGIIATRAWDVLTSHTPLVGQYSEAGLVIHGQVMHSPGPMLYWLLALPARFGSVTSIALTMCIVNALAIVGCVALARRRGGLVLMFATAAGIALMCQSLPTEGLHDVWNPAAGLFPFLLLLFLGWSLACGEYRLLPITALCASYVTQTHLMYAAPTAVVLTIGCGGLLARSAAQFRAKLNHEAGRRARRVWPWALSALAATAACWTEPAIDQISNTPGNLSIIVRTAEHRGATLGVGDGWHAVVHSVGVPAWWLYVPASQWERKYDVVAEPSTTATSSAIAILCALALAGSIGACVGRWDLLAAALIGLGLCAAIALEVASNPSTRLLAETLGYTMWWGSELGLWVWLILAWALWLGVAGLVCRGVSAAREHWSLLRQAARPADTRALALRLASLAGLGAVAAVGSAVAATAKPDTHVYEYRSIRALAAGIERIIPAHQAIAYQLGALDPGTQPMEPAIRFLLVRHGDRVLANGSLPRLGPYYEQSDRPVQWVVYLTDAIRRVPGMRLAARVRFLSPWREETVSAWLARPRASQLGSSSRTQPRSDAERRAPHARGRASRRVRFRSGHLVL